MNIRACSATLFLALVLLSPSAASADFLSAWVRGDGSYINGGNELRYFSNNDAGLGYGFALGAEVVQIDVLIDANFHPQGSQWNQVGLGFDMDLMPFEKFELAPAAQALYFFAKHHDGSESDRGLYGRAGIQTAYRMFPMFWLGAEGFGGYVFSLPDKETGFVYQVSAFLSFRLKIL